MHALHTFDTNHVNDVDFYSFHIADKLHAPLTTHQPAFLQSAAIVAYGHHSQTKADADIGERVAEYALRIWRRDHLPAHSIVVLLRPASTVPTSPFTIGYGGNERLRYTYDMIKLWELDPALVLATNEYHLWPLAGLMGVVTAESTIAVAEQILAAPLPRYEQGELTGLLALLSSLRIDRETIVQALRRSRMIEDILKESSLYEVILEEGMQKGLEKGVEKGRSEGRLAATRQLARDAVAARFPGADVALLDRIDMVTDTAVLRCLILTLADFPDLAAVQTTINAASAEE
jgi:predicted transposase YdaD